MFLEPDGSVKYLTDPDPRTGATHVRFDPLDWIHALVRQIADPRMHLVRYQGAYANRVRQRYRAEPEPEAAVEGVGLGGGDALAAGAELSESEARSRRSWARMIRRIYEVDPLVCPRCGDELKIVSVITDPVVVDQILAHRERRQTRGLFDACAPPGE